MENFHPIDFDPDKSSKCKIKTIKGFFRYQDNRTEEKHPLIRDVIKEIADGVYLNFVVRYLWEGNTGDKCYLEIGWEPTYLDNKESKRYCPKTDINDLDYVLSDYFNAEACSITINGTQITNLLKYPTNFKSAEDPDNPIRSKDMAGLNSYSMGIFNDTLNPALIGEISLDSNVKNIEISFNYKYTLNDITTYINIDDVNKVKIFKTSKYEKNIVFNHAGLNEMIDYFKKYPVVGIEKSEKYGHIKISHGSSEKNIDIAPYGFEEGTHNELLCSTNFLPFMNNQYTIGQEGIQVPYGKDIKYYQYNPEDDSYIQLIYDGNFLSQTATKVSKIELPVTNNQFKGSYVIYMPALDDVPQINELIPFQVTFVNEASVDGIYLTLQEALQDQTMDAYLLGREYVNKSFNIKCANFKLNTPYSFQLERSDTFILGFNVQFVSDQILNDQKPNKKWKNLYLTDTLVANKGIFNTELRASNIYGAFRGTESGESININDSFIVQANGDVQLKGNITWGVNQFSYVYHKGQDNQPSRIPPTPTNSIIYEEDVEPSDTEKRWHKQYNSNISTGQNDHWISMTFDGGHSWSTPTYINAEDGKKGNDGYWTNENILEALKQEGVADGLFYFPGDVIEETGEVTNSLAFKAQVVRAVLASFNKIDMSPDIKYNSQANSSFNGGYISFAIPNPFTKQNESETEPVLIPSKPGWRARLGYLKGNGDGQTATAGIGFAIYTEATWDDVYPDNKISVIPEEPQSSTSSATKHLVLAILMFTQSGLGRLTVQNTRHMGTTPYQWLSNDTLVNSNGATVPHYGYDWWGNKKDPININNRLWIDENNGGLYRSTNNQTLAPIKKLSSS